jgi:hypothetical protein
MFAAAHTATSAASPDQPRVGMDMPTRIGCVLRLVRRLIDYGRQVADTVQQRASAPGFARFARPFGTTDLAVILARITRGLRRAAALETRLCRRAARDQPLASKPFRTSPTHEPRPARRPATQPAAPPKSRTTDPRLANLPTEDEIAAEVRRRPIGAVIVTSAVTSALPLGSLIEPSGRKSATPS